MQPSTLPPRVVCLFHQGEEGGEKETTTMGALSQNGNRLLSRLPVANLSPPPETPLENYSFVLRSLKHHNNFQAGL